VPTRWHLELYGLVRIQNTTWNFTSAREYKNPPGTLSIHGNTMSTPNTNRYQTVTRASLRSGASHEPLFVERRARGRTATTHRRSF